MIYRKGHKCFFAVLWMLMLCLPASGLLAQEISAKLSVEQKDYIIGDLVPVEMSLRYPAGYNPRLTPVWPYPHGLELQKVMTKDSTAGNAGISHTLVFEFLALDTGLFELPASEVHFLKDGQQADLDIPINAVQFHVRLAEVDTTQDIKPIVGPYQAAEETGIPWEYIIVALLAVALLALLFFILRNKPKTGTEPVQVVLPKSLYLESMEAIKKMGTEKPWLQGQTKEYYTRLSHILRNYISHVFKIDALDLTTAQTMEQLARMRFPLEGHLLLKNILTKADMVKFAKLEPEPAENEESVEDGIKALSALHHYHQAMQAKENPASGKEEA